MIRRAQSTDTDAIRALIAQLDYDPPASLEEKIRRLSTHPDEVLLVYELDTEVVAFLSLHFILHILWSRLDPRPRRQSGYRHFATFERVLVFSSSSYTHLGLTTTDPASAVTAVLSACCMKRFRGISPRLPSASKACCSTPSSLIFQVNSS